MTDKEMHSRSRWPHSCISGAGSEDTNLTRQLLICWKKVFIHPESSCYIYEQAREEEELRLLASWI